MNSHPDQLHRSIEAAKSLRLELARMLVPNGEEMTADDLQALQDSFDGETTLDVQIRGAVLAIEEDEIFVRGIKAREAELKERRLRFERRIEATRGLIEQAMTIAQWPKHEMDIGTVTLGKAQPRLEIDDESQIPSQFFKRADPTLDRAGLLRVLKEHHKAGSQSDVPGCHLETGGTTLTIRRG